MIVCQTVKAMVMRNISYIAYQLLVIICAFQYDFLGLHCLGISCDVKFVKQ